jgi:hypothetical protein
MTHPTPNIAASVEHTAHLQLNLRQVQAGIKSRAPGIRRCQDCAEPYIDDRVGLVHCPTCRVNHRRYCRGCWALMPNTTQGDRLCDCCQDQLALF